MRNIFAALAIASALSLFAGCGSNFEWFPSTVTATTANTAPVANAGSAQTVSLGALVTLNGSGSSDANGDALTYSWSFTAKPNGSAATLSSATAVSPTFTADFAGVYVLSLTVNDGTVSSTPATVTITAVSVVNVAPVANAGPAQTVDAGKVVTLDGSGSTDANGDPLTYKWTFTNTIPAGSAATLSSDTAVKPTFTPDLAGIYELSLTVNDGTVNSTPSTVLITATNTLPVANAGPDQTVLAGATVQLDGSGSSDANGEALTYLWSIITRPNGSTATLSSATVVNPTFIADLPGIYTVRLQVFDKTGGSNPATVTVTSTLPTGSITVSW